MAQLAPFRALRPAPDNAVRVAAPPYDVIDTNEARALAAGNPDSFLHVSRPEIDLPVGTDEHGEAVYAQGAAALGEFIRRGVLEPDHAAGYYVYRQVMAGHVQHGLVACASVAEYVADSIKKHEKTRADKEDDRTRHIDVIGAHDEPVFLTYRAVAAIDRGVASVVATSPVNDFTTADGVRHTLWRVDARATEQLKALFASEVSALYVADGHHRSAAAARVHARREGTPGEHGVFLAVIFPHDQMQILPYNRVVRDPKGRDETALIAELSTRFDLAPSDAAAPDRPHTFGVFTGSRWHRATVRAGTWNGNDPVASLDCSIVQEQLLAPVFGIHDPRRDRNVDFVGGIRGTAELERRVREDGFSLALAMYPTTIEQLLAVSDAGLLMPPKSTWFEPKLRSGLFVHRF